MITNDCDYYGYSHYLWSLMIILFQYVNVVCIHTNIGLFFFEKYLEKLMINIKTINE